MSVGAPPCGLIGIDGLDEEPDGEPGITTPIGGKDGTGADWVDAGIPPEGGGLESELVDTWPM
jgi:hypothetical protein